MVPLKITLPEHFLDEEERCGYVVSHEMKKVWAVMLDLLAEFDRVCKKNNLNYQASWGTLLGAVRHKGYIPWDDDMDVQMFREDYDKLCTIGPSEFRHPYFFQSKITDPGAGSFFCILRNSETTALSSSETNSITDYKIRYKEECEKCDLNKMCGGFFASTINMKDIKVHPILLKGEINV